MIVLTMLTALVALIGVFVFLTVLNNFQPGERRMQQEIKKLWEDMNTWAGELVPIDKEELALLSYSQIKQIRRKGWSPNVKGIFTSIYNEPIIAYSYKEFLGKGRHAILYARSANHEFAYWIRPKEIRVVIDGALAGNLKNGALISPKSGKPIAQLQEAKNSLLPVVINNREVGSLSPLSAQKNKGLGQRALEFIKDDITQEEETLLLSLAVLEMVRRNNSF